jgi:hypothetical protein
MEFKDVVQLSQKKKMNAKYFNTCKIGDRLQQSLIGTRS